MYHPQGDGQTEIHNRTIKQLLRGYVNYQQDNWVDLLPILEFGYNNSRNASTGHSPFYVDMGRNPKPWALIGTDVNGAVVDTLDRGKEMDELHAIVKANIEDAQATQAKYYNRHH